MKIKISLRSNFPLKTSNNPKHLFTFPPFRVPQPPHKSQANQNIPQPTFLRDLSRYVWLKTFSFTHFIISTDLRLFGNVFYKNARRWETTPPRIIWQKWRKKLKIVASPLSFPPPSGGDLLQPGAASTLELLLPRYEANYLSCHPCTNTLAASIHLLHLWEQVWEALGGLGGGGDVVQVPANECSVWPSHKNFQVGAKPLGNMCMCNVCSLSHQCILAVGVQQWFSKSHQSKLACHRSW